jgi:hypothetical protein
LIKHWAGRSIITTILVLVITIPAGAEYIFLKDGSIIKGRVIKETLDDVIFTDEQKKESRYPRKDVIRIFYGTLKTGKLYIQRVEGDPIEAYLVDEETDSYTFRIELNHPEEFTLKKEEIYFMTQKNPSGLKISDYVGATSVSISWLPPYTPIKKYNIYIRESKSEKFELLESTDRRSVILGNLRPETTYYLYITCVDGNNYESLPGNEIKITTLAEADARPEDKKYVMSSVKNKIGVIYWEVPSGLRIAYTLGTPLCSKFSDNYDLFNGVDLSYLYFFNNNISMASGLNYLYGEKAEEGAAMHQSSFSLGMNFGIPVIGFIYPYAGLSLKGLWFHEEGRLQTADFGGMGVDGNAGISISYFEKLGFFMEYNCGWAMVFDKSYANASMMSLKAGMYYRF